MLTIDYDKPIKNLIPELSKTGHVTHTSYKKTSVTFHHNAGNLTHEGLLSVWRVRPASAHFDVDAHGKIAQYVKVDEYAWAVGNTEGNRSTISIEMADETFAPEWKVSETTWRAGARLAGWLFAHEVGELPTRHNLFYHHRWSPTQCPGPYMDKIYTQLLAATQAAYSDFTDGVHIPTQPSTGKKSIATIAKEVIAGKWGNGDERVKRLTAAGYDAKKVQSEVNRQVGSSTPRKKTVVQIAKEVIAGKWGNGEERVERLTKAGYDAKKVQAEVNRQLK